MTNRWTGNIRTVIHVIMLLLHTLTMRRIHAASLVKYCPVVLEEIA